jgi:hypothetical protein
MQRNWQPSSGGDTESKVRKKGEKETRKKGEKEVRKKGEKVVRKKMYKK